MRHRRPPRLSAERSWHVAMAGSEWLCLVARRLVLNSVQIDDTDAGPGLSDLGDQDAVRALFRSQPRQ